MNNRYINRIFKTYDQKKMLIACKLFVIFFVFQKFAEKKV